MAAIFNQFFGSYEGPPFNLIKTYDDGLEVREYLTYKWVGTKRGPEDKGTLGENGMFWRLFNYISGENENKQKIAMTVPVSTWVGLDAEGKEVEGTREMCFFLGQEHQPSPPKPTNDKVFIVERPPMTIYTRKIGGYVKDRMWAEEAEHIKKMIKENDPDAQIDETGYYQNGYDAPMKFINRKNEVWWVKKA